MAHSCVSVRSRQAAERGIEAKCQRLLRGEDSAPGPGLALKGTSTLYGEDGTVKLQWVKTDKDMEKLIEIQRAALAAMCSEY